MPVIKASPLLKKTTPRATKKSTFRHDLRDLLEYYGTTLGITEKKALQTLRSKQNIALIGLEKSGQSSLFTLNNLSFECHYPPQDTQHITEESHHSVQWHFHEQGTWIDIPAALFAQKETKEVHNLCHNLHAMKPHEPLSALVIALEANSFHESLEALAPITALLKSRIALFNRLLGLATPVFILLTKADKIVGFSELFSDTSGRWNEQYLGFFFTEEERKHPLAKSLEHESTKLAEHLRLIEIKMLARTKEDGPRLLVGSFAIAQGNLQKRVILFTLQLLTDASGKTTNPLGGIFYTSVREQLSWFTQPLITSLIPSHHNNTLHHTKEAVKVHHKRDTILGCVVGTFAVLTILFLFTLSVHYQRWGKEALSDMSQPIYFTPQGISTLHTYALRADEMEKKSRFGMFIAGFNPLPLEKELRHRHDAALTMAIARPVHQTITTQLAQLSTDKRGGPSNNFMTLKGYLRLYLAQSNEGAHYEGVYDSTALLEAMLPIVQKRFFGHRTPSDDEIQKLTASIGSYISRMNAPHPPILFPINSHIVSHTQERLVALYNIRAIYETTMAQLRPMGKKLYLLDMVPEANEVNINSEQPLSEVYTAEGWNAIVSKEFTTATRRLKSVEPWLVGSNSEKLALSISPQELERGMKTLYLEDVALQWLHFLGSIKLYRFNSLPEASLVLLKLGSNESALSQTITHFCTMRTELLQAGKRDPHADLFDQFAEQTRYLELINAPLNELKKRYQDAGKGIAEKRQEKTLFSLFNGSSDDPFVAGYAYLENTLLPPLPSLPQECMRNLLTQPINNGCVALKEPLSKELNAFWAPLHDTYTSQFAGRYPFDNGATAEANLRATLEFFHPDKGIFWTTYHQAFSGYIQENNGVWNVRYQPGMVHLDFPRDLVSVFSKADRIRQAFYADGVAKEWQVTINPSQSLGLSKAEIVLGTETTNLMQRPPMALSWPNDAPRTQLLLTDRNNNLALLENAGPWGFMRLMHRGSMASRDQQFSNSFPLQFTIRTHARQTSLSATAVVSSRFHPFATNHFQGVHFPKNFAL